MANKAFLIYITHQIHKCTCEQIVLSSGCATNYTNRGQKVYVSCINPKIGNEINFDHNSIMFVCSTDTNIGKWMINILPPKNYSTLSRRISNCFCCLQ